MIRYYFFSRIGICSAGGLGFGGAMPIPMPLLTKCIIESAIVGTVVPSSGACHTVLP